MIRTYFKSELIWVLHLCQHTAASAFGAEGGLCLNTDWVGEDLCGCVRSVRGVCSWVVFQCVCLRVLSCVLVLGNE